MVADTGNITYLAVRGARSDHVSWYSDVLDAVVEIKDMGNVRRCLTIYYRDGWVVSQLLDAKWSAVADGVLRRLATEKRGLD